MVFRSSWLAKRGSGGAADIASSLLGVPGEVQPFSYKLEIRPVVDGSNGDAQWSVITVEPTETMLSPNGCMTRKDRSAMDDFVKHNPDDVSGSSQRRKSP